MSNQKQIADAIKMEYREEVSGYMDDIRKKKFKDKYKPKHQILFDYQYMNENEKENFLKEYIHPDMHWARKSKTGIDYVLREPIWEVNTFPLFTKKFCRMIIEEVENFDEFIGEHEGVNKKRPYTTTDSHLDCYPGRHEDDVPLSFLYDDIKSVYIHPILSYVWGFQVKDDENSWVARYNPDEQKHLKFHTDDAVCASVVSLNNNFEGGGTIFLRQKTKIEPKRRTE